MEKIDHKQIFINSKNLLNNYKIIREKSGNSKIMSVIKGDAYGHGIQECMEILKKSGCRHFYVARLEDCLLYTSPSPRDGLLSRMPSSA